MYSREQAALTVMHKLKWTRQQHKRTHRFGVKGPRGREIVSAHREDKKSNQCREQRRRKKRSEWER